jgi:hypothetical protein
MALATALVVMVVPLLAHDIAVAIGMVLLSAFRADVVGTGHERGIYSK